LQWGSGADGLRGRKVPEESREKEQWRKHHFGIPSMSSILSRSALARHSERSEESGGYTSALGSRKHVIRADPSLCSG
jgi:hypothetical protein